MKVVPKRRLMEELDWNQEGDWKLDLNVDVKKDWERNQEFDVKDG